MTDRIFDIGNESDINQFISGNKYTNLNSFTGYINGTFINPIEFKQGQIFTIVTHPVNRNQYLQTTTNDIITIIRTPTQLQLYDENGPGEVLKGGKKRKCRKSRKSRKRKY